MTTPKATKTSQGGKKKEDGVYDLEQQFILRLPPGSAMALKRDVDSGNQNLKDKLLIEIQQDMRHGKVTYGGQVYNAKLVDLPGVIESLKTTDRKTLYKVADICQMLIATLDDDSDSVDENEQPGKKKDKEKKYKYAHGITPPLKNVRKRRFRKTLQKKYQEQPDIEKEVKRLFRMDNEAIDVKWEVVIEEAQPQNPATAESQVLIHGETSKEKEKESVKAYGQNLLELARHEIFGELSSSEEEEEEDKDINVDIMDSGDDVGHGHFSRLEDSCSDVAHLSLLDTTNLSTNMSTDGDSGELQLKLQELGKQLDEIKEKRMAHEIVMAMTDDMEQRLSMQAEMNSLIDEESKKQNEFEILSSMLNQA